ncbi:MAG: TlyA family RNA methyltransferase [Eubacterium sp.]|nr:TlyA family RNA methyltransferase [Eubacterium sp.]
MKDRLDVVLVEKGFFQSREKAKAAIMAGIVYVDGQKSDKAGTTISKESDIEVRGNTCPYVSRGGLKLEKAMELFNFNLDGTVCVDMGASTGGFTDCMLQKGAVKVYAIDVGYGQLDYKLRVDPRVVNMEKTNIRYMDTALIEEPANCISIDVSFISLNLIFPVAAKVLAEDGGVVALVKPQFEAGREQVGKKGIVRDKNVHKEVIEKVIGYAQDVGLYPAGLTFSPVTGAKGNIEYLLYLTKEDREFDMELVNEIVENSHRELDK